MKRRIITAAVVIAAFVVTVQSANAQFFRFGWRFCGAQRYATLCRNGSCYGSACQYAPTQCYSGNCAETSTNASVCTNGTCKFLQPMCANGSCAVQEYKPICNEKGETENLPYTSAETNVRDCDACALLQRVNATRARYGLGVLKQDENLERGSQNQTWFCARSGCLLHGAGAYEILAINGQGIEILHCIGICF